MTFEKRTFIDYFVVCGLDKKQGLEPEPTQLHDEGVCKSPLERSYKCSILSHYPASLAWNPIDEYAVSQLCLPKGLVFQKYSSKPRFHPFVITREDGSRIYGSALKFYELVEEESICNAMQTLQTMFDAEFDHSLVHYNKNKDKLYCSKCICLISQYLFTKSFAKILHTLYDMVEQHDLLGMSFESHLYNLIYEIPMPSSGRILNFSIGSNAMSIYMPDHVSSDDLPPFDFDLFEFFKILGVNNSLNLFITTLLEHQVLLYSKDYYLLMLVAESLTTLLFPFTWLKPYVPIVPASNLHFIEAPVPYIMGFHNHDIDKEFFKQGQRCFVDIDSGTVTCPEGLPEFPEKNKFIKEISDVIAYFTEKHNSLKTLNRQKNKKIQDLGEKFNSNTENDTEESNDVLRKSHAFARITELARKAGAIRLNDDFDRNRSDASAKIDENHLISLQFSSVVRELFLNKFVQMFSTYEKFVIVPNLKNEQIETWWANREYSGNFDAKMFLIEQPSPRLPFMSHFLSTQMFASFIDLKIISIIDAKKSEPNIKIFDDRIKKYKRGDANTSIYDFKMESPKALFDLHEIENELIKKLSQDPIVAPKARPRKVKSTAQCKENWFNASDSQNSYLFESIDENALKPDEEYIRTHFNELQNRNDTLRVKREQFTNSELKLSLDKPTKEKEATNPEANDKEGQKSEKSQKATELNPIFIQSLLKESKFKTKRMLVDKMPEVVHLGHSETRINGVEENMLIASLCDLIERIWSHGLHGKPVKSSLWNHLNSYRKLIQYLNSNNKTLSSDLKYLTPKTNPLPRKQGSIVSSPEIFQSQLSPLLSFNRTFSNNLYNQLLHSSSYKRNTNAEIQFFAPLKNDLFADLARIDKLNEAKTEIGMARAFVRLSLEKKLLAGHLRQLLSETDLLKALYKRHSFLRQEDEREQFIYHLQSLNVVDYFCFTNHFKSIPTDYSVLIVPSRKFNSSTTSANPYIKLYGSLGESPTVQISKSSVEFTISCESNLGRLSTLIIGHDNAGISPKWMIECIFVRNEITGYLQKFPCGRWLGKGIDDDSLERLLIAEPIEQYEINDLLNMQGFSSPYNSNRSSSPTFSRNEEKKLQPNSVQEMLGYSINTLVKFFEKNDSDKVNLTSLMCGEQGLVSCMDSLFSFGFKSYKLFKRLYVWDFLEKVCNELEALFYSNQKLIILHQPTIDFFLIEKFLNVIKTINSVSPSYGKDRKFQIFICLACRDSFLADWFMLLSKSNTTNQMYEESSFLRNSELNKFTIKILSIVNQFNFQLENSLTMEINY
jgi:hypothetical protein